jgi:FkbM family methyltransferase
MHPLLHGFLHHPMANRRPIPTAWRIFVWQIVGKKAQSRIVEFGTVSKLLVKKGMAGATGNMYYGLHEFDEMMFFLKALRSEDHFVDIGANIGSYSVLVGKEIGCRVRSFEPNPQAFEYLQMNVELNNIQGLCDLVCAGVGAEQDELGFSDGLDTTNHVQLEGGQTRIPIIALDDQHWPLDSVFMKIDVEGFEAFVLDGGKVLFKTGKVKAFSMELNGACCAYGLEEGAIFEKILSWGYSAHYYTADKNELTSISKPTSTNTLFILNQAFNEIHERLLLAKPVTIHGVRW